MKVTYKDGPMDWKTGELPNGVTEWRIAIAEPIDYFATVDQSYPISSMPTYKVATYRFTGLGIVDQYGKCDSLVFDYQGTIDG